VYCSKCGKEVDESSEFCKHCGARLAGDTPEAEPKLSAEHAEAVPTYEKPKMIPPDMIERNERMVFETHPSKMEAFFKYIAGGILLIAGGIALMVLLGWVIFGWVLIGAGAIIGLIGFIKWRSVIYGLTTDRIIVLSGILSKHLYENRLDRVQDIRMDISIRQRIFNYGDISITTAGTGGVEYIWRNIPEPRKRQRQLRTVVAG